MSEKTTTQSWPKFMAAGKRDGKSNANISKEWKALKAQEPTQAVQAVTSKTSDPHDKKLDYFQYDRDATSYEFEKANPLNVPMEIAKRYPHMRFRWRKKDEKAGTLIKGNDHLGWKIFTDGNYKDGVRSGGDLILTAMPEERAAAYNKYTQEQSTNLIKEEQIAKADGPYGIEVGAGKVTNKNTGEVSEQHRGLHPDELKEIAIRSKENRDKQIVYSR